MQTCNSSHLFRNTRHSGSGVHPFVTCCAGQLDAATSRRGWVWGGEGGEGGVYPFVSSCVPVNFTLPPVGVYPFVSSMTVSLTLLLVGGGGGGVYPFCQFCAGQLDAATRWGVSGRVGDLPLYQFCAGRLYAATSLHVCVGLPLCQ